MGLRKRPSAADLKYRQQVLVTASQLRGVGEGGSMHSLIKRADTFLRTGTLPPS